MWDSSDTFHKIVQRAKCEKLTKETGVFHVTNRERNNELYLTYLLDQELDPEKEIEEKEAYEAQEAQAAERSAPATMKRAAAEPRKSIYLYVPSSKLWYGSYNTRYYTTNEGKYAYCIEPRRKAPKAGYYSASVMYNTNVRKAAYYAYGGPGYSKYRASYGNIWDGSQKNEYIYSHIIISYIYAKYYLGSNSEANFAFYGLSSRAKSKLITKANNLLKLSAPPSGYTCYTMATSYKSLMSDTLFHPHSYPR